MCIGLIFDFFRGLVPKKSDVFFLAENLLRPLVAAVDTTGVGALHPKAWRQVSERVPSWSDHPTTAPLLPTRPT